MEDLVASWPGKPKPPGARSTPQEIVEAGLWGPIDSDGFPLAGCQRMGFLIPSLSPEDRKWMTGRSEPRGG